MADVESNPKELEAPKPKMADVESNVKELEIPKSKMADEEVNPKELKTPEHKEMNHCGFRRTIFILFAVIFVILVLLAALIVILYLILKPKAPEVTLSSMEVGSLDLSSGNTSLTNRRVAIANVSALDDLNLDTNVTLYLDMYNPNKVDISFKFIKIFAYYSTSFAMGKTSIPPFKQDKASSVNLTTQLIGKNLPMSQKLGTAFLNAYLNDSIPLKFIISASASIKIWGFASPDATVKVGCNLKYKPMYKQISNKVCSVRAVRVG